VHILKENILQYAMLMQATTLLLFAPCSSNTKSIFMQKLRYTLLLAILFTSLSNPACFGTKVWGSTLPKELSNPFQDDLSQFDREMSQLTELEQLVLATHATQTQLVNDRNLLTQYLLQGDDLAESLFGSSAPDRERLVGIPGFLWGFCCSVVGMFLVYIAIDDPAAKKKEGKQAILGCAVGTLLYVGIYLYFLYTVAYF